MIAKIAGGGMSAVYLGRRLDPDMDVPNVVALKIVRHDVAKDEQLVKMFLEEGKLLARLVHPNIVRTLEVGGDAEQDFIAMELMLGKTFAAIHDALVARGVRLNPEIAAWTAARIADALHYAHELTDEAGRPLALVHRDVNPANVFATFNGEVKLFDFGLAKVTAGEASGSQMLAGKLSYLSPEQIMQMPLDRRSDIFSLGTTLWELLTSKRLFRRDTDIDTVRAVQLGPIPDPRTVAPEIPEELARIARTALERNRDHRYPSAAYLARELDAFVYTRSSPADVTARLAQLVDTLFPGEQKRQAGWLKPAISSSISRSMNAVATTPRPPGTTSRPAPPEVRRDSRETTVVMANAPPVPSSSRESLLSANTVRDGIPAVTTARDGVPAVHADHDGTIPSVAPSTPRERVASGSPPISPRDGAHPPSATMREGVPSVRPPGSLPPGSLPPAAPGPSSRTSWPVPSQRSAPAPPPQRSRPPASMPPPSITRTDVQAIPPAPESRTEIQHVAPTEHAAPPARSARPPHVAPTIETPAVFPSPPAPGARPPRDRESTPSMKPSSPVAGLQPGPRPKRAPIPLPSRASSPPKAQSSRKIVSDPPDSEPTQVDMPVPPGRKR